MFDNLGPPPWFKTADSKNIENSETKALTIFTEDAFFCAKVNSKGYKIGVHTGARIGHMNVRSGEVY
jgi:GT2 family glycosyltransferase